MRTPITLAKEARQQLRKALTWVAILKDVEEIDEEIVDAAHDALNALTNELTVFLGRE